MASVCRSIHAPLRGRAPVVTSERSIERCVRGVPDTMSNLLHRIRRGDEEVTSELHPQVAQVRDRWLTEQLREPLDECRA